MRVVTCALVAVSLVAAAHALACPVFDSDFNLYVFGQPQADVRLGQPDALANPSPTSLSTSGRPPFDAGTPRCHLAQFFNAIYIVNADKADPLAIYIFNVRGNSWSKQSVSAGGLDPSDAVEILDHDTNVFYAVSKRAIFSLDMADQVAAAAPKTWVQMVDLPWLPPTGYVPTMGIAQNHIHFFGIETLPAGSAYIFVIHFAYPQPEPQDYRVLGGKRPFPTVHGASPSLFRTQGTQETIAFVPDDGSGTYLVSVDTNRTLVLPPPPAPPVGATFAAGLSNVVQIAADGKMYQIPVNQADLAASGVSSRATWSPINFSVAGGGGAPPPSSGSSASSSTTRGATGTRPAPSGTTTSAPGGATSTPPPSSALRAAAQPALLALGLVAAGFALL